MTDLVEVRKSYLPPSNRFEEIAQRWSELLNFPITAAQVVMMLLDVKIMHIRDSNDQEEMMRDRKLLECLERVLLI